MARRRERGRKVEKDVKRKLVLIKRQEVCVRLPDELGEIWLLPLDYGGRVDAVRVLGFEPTRLREIVASSIKRFRLKYQDGEEVTEEQLSPEEMLDACSPELAEFITTTFLEINGLAVESMQELDKVRELAKKSVEVNFPAKPPSDAGKPPSTERPS